MARAADVAIKHFTAMCDGDRETVRDLLADDVHYILITPMPGFPNPHEGHGVEQFMQDATLQNALVPQSLRVLKSIGDDRQALILVRVEATFGPSAMTLLAARHYVIDANAKITNELVIISNYEGEV